MFYVTSLSGRVTSVVLATIQCLQLQQWNSATAVPWLTFWTTL